MADLQLIVVDGPNQGTEFDISGSSVIGRDPSSGIVLDDAEASRRHASVSAAGDTIMVEDLGSTNGTYVAGERIQGSREVASGDRIRIGTTVMEVRVAAAATAAGAMPEAEDPQATRIGGMPIPDAPAGDAGEPGGEVAGGPAEPPTMPEPEAPSEPAAPEPAAFETSGPPDPPTGEPAAFEPPPPPEPPAFEPPRPPEPPAYEPPSAPEPPVAPEPPQAPEQPAAFEPPAPPEPEPPAPPEPEPPAEPEPAGEPEPAASGFESGGADEGATQMRPVQGFDQPPADEGATEMRPVPGGFGDQQGDEGATEMRPVPTGFDAPGDATQAPPPGGGFESGGPPAPEPGPPTEPHYAEGPQASSPPPPPPPGGFGGDPGAPPPPPPFGGGPPPPPPGGGGPEAGPPPPPPGPGYAPPPQAGPGYGPPPGGPLAAPGGYGAPQGPMPPKNPVVEWLLSAFVPIYEYYWFHRSNKEMQAWSGGRIDYNATSSLLAITLGWIIIVPPFIAWSSYVGRVNEARRMAGLPQDVTFWGGIGRYILLRYSVKWLQDKFNEIGTRPPQY